MGIPSVTELSQLWILRLGRAELRVFEALPFRYLEPVILMSFSNSKAVVPPCSCCMSRADRRDAARNSRPQRVAVAISSLGANDAKTQCLKVGTFECSVAVATASSGKMAMKASQACVSRPKAAHLAASGALPCLPWKDVAGAASRRASLPVRSSRHGVRGAAAHGAHRWDRGTPRVGDMPVLLLGVLLTLTPRVTGAHRGTVDREGFGG